VRHGTSNCCVGGDALCWSHSEWYHGGLAASIHSPRIPNQQVCVRRSEAAHRRSFPRKPRLKVRARAGEAIPGGSRRATPLWKGSCRRCEITACARRWRTPTAIGNLRLPASLTSICHEKWAPRPESKNLCRGDVSSKTGKSNSCLARSRSVPSEVPGRERALPR